MREIAFFGEDHGHELIVGALIKKIARDQEVEIRFHVRNARHGHGAVVRELKRYLKELEEPRKPIPTAAPDLIIVATDANCRGRNERIKEFKRLSTAAKLIYAIPDPHVEHWLLLDESAFKKVLGSGCRAPAYKCERDYYKQYLLNEICATNKKPPLGGLEYAKDIIWNMDIRRAANKDDSFKNFADELRNAIRR